ADPIAYQNHLFRGGRGPVCEDSADVTADNLLENDDALEVIGFLVSGSGEIGVLDPNDCFDLDTWPEGQCRALDFQLTAPERVSDSAFEAAVLIRAGAAGVQGWSFSVRAEGCEIAAVDTAGTPAAETFDEPPGLRSFGYYAGVPV